MKGASENKLKTNVLRAPVGPDQIKCLGQYRFRGDNVANPFLQRRYAFIVQFFISVHEGDERTGIQ